MVRSVLFNRYFILIRIVIIAIIGTNYLHNINITKVEISYILSQIENNIDSLILHHISPSTFLHMRHFG